MAQIKDLIVNGVSRFLGTVYGSKFVVNNGTSTQFLKGDGSLDSNSYALSSNIPTVNDATLTIQQDGVTKGTFTANASNNATINIDLSGKQDSLNSGQNIKTINGASLLGSGNIDTNSPFVVTFTQSNDAITCDSSIYQINSNYYNGKIVVAKFNGVEYLLTYCNSPMIVFSSPVSANGNSYNSLTGMSSGSDDIETDAWVFSTSYVQPQLTSGTNIKTINSNSILGNGDLTLNGANLNYTGNANSYVTPNNPINDAIEDLDNALHDLGTPNEIASITTTESQMSGGNNVVTITDTDGNSTSFNVKNGLDGHDGADGISLGEIGLVQNTGYDTDKVMSQHAVTKNISRLNEEDLSSIENLTIESAPIPDGYLQLSYIDNGTAGSGARIDTGLLPDDINWRFVGSWARTGTPTTAYAPVIIAYTSESSNCYRIGREGTDDRRLRCVAGNLTTASAVFWLSDTNINVWHTYDLKYGSVIVDGVSHALQTTQGTTLTGNLYIGHKNYPQKIGEFKAYYNDTLVAHLIPCKAPDDTIGMYDIVRRQFFGSDNENDFIAGDIIIGASNKLLSGSGLASLITQEKGDSETKLMSQAAISRELDTNGYYAVKPTYFKGVLTRFYLDDYPTLDVRKCDGFSLVFDSIPITSGRKGGFMTLLGNTYDNNVEFFGIEDIWGNFKAGIFKGYGNTDVQVASVSISAQNRAIAHGAFTVDFKTGVFKIYKNGVLKHTVTPSNYDYDKLLTVFNQVTKLYLGTGLTTSGFNTSAMAIFGHVLTDSDIQELYGSGCSSVRGKLIPTKWYANQLIPHIITDWGEQHYNCTVSNNENGGKTFTASTNVTYIRFGFTGIPITGDNAVRGNIIYEWDFVVLSGSATANYNMRNGNPSEKSWVAINENNEEVVEGSLFTSGNTYHVINKPDNLGSLFYDTTGTSLHLGYVFNSPSSDFSIWVKPQLKLTERGAAIICSTETYRKTGWEMPSGLILPNTNIGMYGLFGLDNGTIHQEISYGEYKEQCIPYSASACVQFNGQMAIDATSGKVYVGYLTSNDTGVWKQINNS